ncbi:MAG TPA: hypothetical protein VMX97_18000, partial [Hyphomicrobiaceae bacterium]|nr:hypothetical protein [Hyphomicrobiaceae bacterium]
MAALERRAMRVVIGFMLVAATATAALPSSRWHENADTTWERCLYKGLQLYCQGEYRATFNLIEKAVRSAKPGPEAHRSLALMYKAFARVSSLQTPVGEWNESAKQYLDRLEALKEPSDADLVILAALKHVHVRSAPSTPTSEPFLDKLIDPARKSPWRDWAYWEKARVVASKAYVSTRIAWGSVEFLQGDTRQIGCLDDHPDETLRARAAEAFLKENPDSYMGRAMRTDLYYWRLFEARRALARFAKNEWYVGDRGNDVFPLTDDQLKHIASARASLSALARLFPESSEKLGQAESRLDE